MPELILARKIDIVLDLSVVHISWDWIQIGAVLVGSINQAQN